MIAKLLKLWRHGIEISHVERLDDRILADIGLRRDEVRWRILGIGPSDPAPPEVRVTPEGFNPDGLSPQRVCSNASLSAT